MDEQTFLKTLRFIKDLLPDEQEEPWKHDIILSNKVNAKCRMRQYFMVRCDTQSVPTASSTCLPCEIIAPEFAARKNGHRFISQK